MSSKQRNAKKDESSKSFITKIAVGTAVSVIMYFVLIALYAAASFKSGASSSMYMPVGIVMGVISGFAGGFAAVRPIRQKGAIYGALCGFASAILCSAALFIINGNKAGNGIFILIAAMIFGGAAGGISAVNLKIKKKY